MALGALNNDIEQVMDVLRDDITLENQYKKLLQELQQADSMQEKSKILVKALDPVTLDNHPRLLKALQIFLAKHPDTDSLVILQGDKEVHQLLLKASSKYFLNKNDPVSIPEMPYNLASIFQRYIETGEVSGLNDDNVIDVLSWSRKYCFEGLEEHCRSYIFSNLEAMQKKDLLELFHWARRENLGYLQMACVHSAQLSQASKLPVEEIYQFTQFVKHSGIDFGSDLKIIHEDTFSLILDHDIRKEDMRKALEWFNITELTLEGLKHQTLIDILELIETNQTIKKLYVDAGSPVYPLFPGVSLEEELSKVLSKNRSIEFFHHKSHSYHLNWKTLAKGIQENTTLTHFDLAYGIWTNDYEAFPVIGEAFLTALMKHPALTHVRISRYRFEQRFELGKKLLHLNLEHSFLSDLAAASIGDGLRNHPSIEILNVRDTGLGDKGTGLIAQGLIENTSLKYLDLSSNGIGREGSAKLDRAISRNKSIEKLHLERNPVDSFSQGSESLQELNLEQTEVAIAALEKAIKNYPRLKSLNIRSVKGVHGDELKALENLHKANPELVIYADQIRWTERGAKEIRPFGAAYTVWR